MAYKMSKSGPKGTSGMKLPVKTLCTNTPAIPKPVASAQFAKGGSK